MVSVDVHKNRRLVVLGIPERGLSIHPLTWANQHKLLGHDHETPDSLTRHLALCTATIFSLATIVAQIRGDYGRGWETQSRRYPRSRKKIEGIQNY
jgi:hypothetical protein